MVIRINALNHHKDNIGKSWDLSLQAFINDRKVNNLAKRTIEWYEEVLGNYLIPFVSKLKVDSPQEFTKEHLDAYIIYLREVRNNQPSSINTKLIPIRAFFNFLFENGYIPEKIKVKKLKADTKVLKLFTEEDIRKIIERPDLEQCRFVAFRNWAICCFLLGTGVRLTTLVNIKIDDLDFVEKQIYLVKCKNRKQYVIPMSPKLESVLDAYLQIRNGELNNWLFVNRFGDKISTKTVQSAVIDHCRRVGVSPGVRISPHTFRHQVASTLVKNGTDLLTTMNILGQNSLAVLKRYVHLNTDDLKAHIGATPLDTSSQKQTKGRKAIKMKNH